MRILLVDDEVSILQVLSGVLRDLGHEVTCARDGAEALLLLAESSPELIVSDIRMPKVDGFRLLELLPRGPRQIPVILISGHGDEALDGMARAAGAVAYLHKPVRVRDLLQAIGQLEESGARE